MQGARFWNKDAEAYKEAWNRLALNGKSLELTWNDPGILVLLHVGLLAAMPQTVLVALLNGVVELDLKDKQYAKIRIEELCMDN